MPGVIGRLFPAEAPAVFAYDNPILANDDPIGIGLDFDRTANGARLDRVFVVIKPDQAGLRYRSAHRMEAVKAPTQWHERGAFFLENLPNRAAGAFRMAMRLGIGDTFVEEPSIQLVIVLEPQARREEALAYQADLVLDLALFPARGRRAGHRLDEIMAAHLKEAAIVLAVLADEDCLHRRLHVVVDAALTDALEKAEGAVMRVKDHLLGLARIGTHERHAAVAEPHMRHLHGYRRAVQHDDFVAPIELVGLTRRKSERHIGLRQRRTAFLAPAYRITANRIVAPVITQTAQLFEKPNKRQPLAGWLIFVLQQQAIQPIPPWPDFGKRLRRAFVMKLARIRADDLPHDLARHAQVPADLLDRFLLYEKRPANLGDRFHNQHSNLGLPKSRRPLWTLSLGVPIGCKSPQSGVLIPCKFTGCGGLEIL